MSVTTSDDESQPFATACIKSFDLLPASCPINKLTCPAWQPKPWTIWESWDDLTDQRRRIWSSLVLITWFMPLAILNPPFDALFQCHLPRWLRAMGMEAWIMQWAERLYTVWHGIYDWCYILEPGRSLTEMDSEKIHVNYTSVFSLEICLPWWRHQMETFSALMAFRRGIHRWHVNSPHKGQWRGALIFSLICAWIKSWVNNRGAGDLRRHRAHYDVIVVQCVIQYIPWIILLVRGLLCFLRSSFDLNLPISFRVNMGTYAWFH